MFVYEIHPKNEIERQQWMFIHFTIQLKKVIQNTLQELEEVISCSIGLEWVTQYEGLFHFTIQHTQDVSLQKVFYNITKELQKFYEEGVSSQLFQMTREAIKSQYKYQQQGDSFSNLMMTSIMFKDYGPDKNFMYKMFELDTDNFDFQQIQQNIQYLRNPKNLLCMHRSNQYNNIQNTTPVTNIQYSIINYEFRAFQNQEKKSDPNQDVIDLFTHGFDTNRKTKFSDPLPVLIFGEPEIDKQLESIEDNRPIFLKVKNNNNLFVYTDISYESPTELLYLQFEFHKKDNITEYDDNHIPVYNLILENYLQNKLTSDIAKINDYGVQVKIPSLSGKAAMMGFYLDEIKKSLDIMIEDINDHDSCQEILYKIYFKTLKQYEEGPIQWGYKQLYDILGDKKIFGQRLGHILKYEIENYKDSEKISSFCTGLNSTIKKGGLRFDMLVSGNVSQDRAKGLFEKLDINLKKLTFEERFYVQEYKLLNLTNNSNYDFKYPQIYKGTDNKNEAVINYYQFDKRFFGSKEAKVFIILDSYLKAFSFDYLRSEEQLGYIVKSEISQINAKWGLIISVQGYRFSTEYISQKIDNFMNNFSKMLNDTIKDEDITNYFKKQKYNKGSNLLLQTEQMWQQCQNRFQLYSQGFFSYDDQINLNKTDILEIWNENFVNSTKLSLPIINAKKNKKNFIEKYEDLKEIDKPQGSSILLYENQKNKKSDFKIEDNQITFYSDVKIGQFKSHFNNFTNPWMPYQPLQRDTMFIKYGGG